MKRFALPLLLILSLFLAACSTAMPAVQAEPPTAPVSPTGSGPSSANDANASSDLTQSDEQGLVTVEVTPLNLDDPADQLEFDIALNTHSIDLSMDLATLAILTTDTGITIQPTAWDAPRGGHHVEGKLVFPTMKDGKSLLEGTAKITLTIIDLDVPSRVFEWDLK